MKTVLILAMLTLSASSRCAQVYSVAVYAGGTSYRDICSCDYPFSPRRYQVTERCWLEDGNGCTIIDVGHKKASGDVLRRFLDVEWGTNRISIPLASMPKKAGAKGSPTSGVKGSGNLAQLLVDCATKRGAHAPTNPIPVIQASWTQRSESLLELILLEGDHFAETAKCLQHIYGAPDTALRSSAPECNGRSVTYTPQQIGTVLNLTGDSGLTVVSVMSKNKP
jgi:hypothetical protein